MSNQSSKWWLDSMTVRGALLSAVAIIKNLLNLACLMGVTCFAISDEETNVIVEAVVGIISALGVGMVVAGRMRATKPLRLKR